MGLMERCPASTVPHLLLGESTTRSVGWGTGLERGRRGLGRWPLRHTVPGDRLVGLLPHSFRVHYASIRES